MKESINIFYQDLKNSFKDLLPIIIVVSFFQAFIIQKIPENLTSIVIGLTIVAIGLALFIRGLELGIFPIGEGTGMTFTIPLSHVAGLDLDELHKFEDNIKTML
jgi:hypothetical protein